MKNLVVIFLTLIYNIGYTQQRPIPFEAPNSQRDKLIKINPSIDHEEFTPNHQLDYWQQRNENTSLRNSSGWKSLGPITIKSSEGLDFYVSGRVRSIDYVNENLIRIGSGSGGIWEYRTKNGKSELKNISGEVVSSPWTGAMDTSPFDENIILYGTGEPGFKAGTGMWRTVNGGQSWQNTSLPTSSLSFSEIKFSKVKGRVWAVGDDAYYSKDDGLTWKGTKRQYITGLAVHPTRPDTAFIGQAGNSIYRTFNGGQTWQRLATAAGLPLRSAGKIKLSMCESNPDIIYAMYINLNDEHESIYKTIDGGNSWTKCIILDANGQEAGIGNALAYHTGMISVSPTNPDHVIIGAFWYAICRDGFTFIGPTSGSHVDYHAAEWSHDGKTVYFGTDGGVTYTDFNNILDLKFELTKIPTLQFVSVAVGKDNKNIIIGGTQDNGLIYTIGQDSSWYYYGGDGGDVALDPDNEDIYYATLGLYNGDLPFHNLRKTPLSVNEWFITSTGIKPDTEWNRLVRTSKIGNINVVATQNHRDLYYSIFKGDLWYEYKIPDFNAFTGIKSMEFTKEVVPKFLISADSDEGSALLCIDFFKGEITPLSYGLPIKRVKVNGGEDFSFPKIALTPDNPKSVFAFIVGRGNHYNEYVFKTHLDTLEWKNISGNLQRLPYTTMLVHPKDENIMIIGTDGYGLFRTDDGGKYWYPWDENIVRGALISDMDYQITNDSVFAVISTYGCGIYKRYMGAGISDSKDMIVNNHLKAYISPQGWLVGENLDKKQTIQLLDINGQIVISNLEIHVDENGTLLYDATQLPTGIYILYSISHNVVSSVKALKL